MSRGTDRARQSGSTGPAAMRPNMDSRRTAHAGISVLVAVQPEILRCGLRYILDGSQGISIGAEAADIAGAKAAIRKRRFDVALVGLRLPGTPGDDLPPALARAPPRP